MRGCLGMSAYHCVVYFLCYGFGLAFAGFLG